jgi:hypothetical protein
MSVSLDIKHYAFPSGTQVKTFTRRVDDNRRVSAAACKDALATIPGIAWLALNRAGLGCGVFRSGTNKSAIAQASATNIVEGKITTVRAKRETSIKRPPAAER